MASSASRLLPLMSHKIPFVFPLEETEGEWAPTYLCEVCANVLKGPFCPFVIWNDCTGEPPGVKYTIPFQ